MQVQVKAGNKSNSKFVTTHNAEQIVDWSTFCKSIEKSIRKFISHFFRRIWNRNQENELIKSMNTDPAYSKVLQSISDFGMALTIEFKHATQ